jgi:hypothetical protein
MDDDLGDLFGSEAIEQDLPTQRNKKKRIARPAVRKPLNLADLMDGVDEPSAPNPQARPPPGRSNERTLRAIERIEDRIRDYLGKAMDEFVADFLTALTKMLRDSDPFGSILPEFTMDLRQAVRESLDMNRPSIQLNVSTIFDEFTQEFMGEVRKCELLVPRDYDQKSQVVRAARTCVSSQKSLLEDSLRTSLADLQSEFGTLAKLRAHWQTVGTRLSRRREAMRAALLRNEEQQHVMDKISQWMRLRLSGLADLRRAICSDKVFEAIDEPPPENFDTVVRDVREIALQAQPARVAAVQSLGRCVAGARNDVEALRQQFDCQWTWFMGQMINSSRSARRTPPVRGSPSSRLEALRARLQEQRRRERERTDELSDFLSQLQANATALRQRNQALLRV